MTEPLLLLEDNKILTTELQARFGAAAVGSTPNEQVGQPTLQLPTARFVTLPATAGSDVQELYVSRAMTG